jgi:hypothetical protein
MIGPAIGLLGAGAVDRAWSPGNKTTAKKQTIKTLRTMLGPACRFMVVVRMTFGSSWVRSLMPYSISSAGTTCDLSFQWPNSRRKDCSTGVERTEESVWSMHAVRTGAFQLFLRMETRSGAIPERSRIV